MFQQDELEAQFTRHPSLPREAVLKSDLLRRGMHFDASALLRAESPDTDEQPQRPHQPKSYFIFSFDMVPQNPCGTSSG